VERALEQPGGQAASHPSPFLPPLSPLPLPPVAFYRYDRYILAVLDLIDVDVY